MTMNKRFNVIGLTWQTYHAPPPQFREGYNLKPDGGLTFLVNDGGVLSPFHPKGGASFSIQDLLKKRKASNFGITSHLKQNSVFSKW